MDKNYAKTGGDGMTAEHNFMGAILASGMQSPVEIIGDGKLRRFSPTGRRGDDAGWYMLHLDGVPAGAFGNWRDGFSQCWSDRDERAMSLTERRALAQRIEHMRRQREEEQRQRRARAAAEAAMRWAAAVLTYDHAYLESKCVRSHGLRLEGSDLLVPLRDVHGNLSGLQTITEHGVKRFLPGSRIKSCYFSIGKLGDRIVICEGFATGATLHEDSGFAVAVAFNAGNLVSVAKALRTKYPDTMLVFAADDDWQTEGNPGMTAARQAAAVVGGMLAVPDFTGLERGAKDTDFNDLRRLSCAMGATA